MTLGKTAMMNVVQFKAIPLSGILLHVIMVSVRLLSAVLMNAVAPIF
jgi:hypothetical protein